MISQDKDSLETDFVPSCTEIWRTTICRLSEQQQRDLLRGMLDAVDCVDDLPLARSLRLHLAPNRLKGEFAHLEES